ncbi:39S ribosomal protein S30, mitochondrial, partial [Clarias magur]
MAVRSRSSLQLFLSAQTSRVICSRNVQVKSAEATPVYPPILPSRTAKSKSAKRRVLLEFFDRLRTVEPQEKISALTRIQRMKYVVCPQTPAVGADKWYQHFTKTAFLPGLPDELSSPADLESVGSELRSILSDALLQEHWHLKKGRAFIQKEYKQFANPFLKNAVSGLVASLARTNPVLQLSSLDLSPHVNFYWVNGERTIPRGHRSGRVEPQRFQIDDRPHSQIRVRKQLPEFVPLGTDVAAEVPVIQFAPDCLPLFRRQYENNISTGAKLQDPCCYGHTQFHVVPDRFHRDRLIAKNLSEHIEVFLRANAIASLFAWTGAQAMYQ